MPSARVIVVVFWVLFTGVGSVVFICHVPVEFNQMEQFARAMLSVGVYLKSIWDDDTNAPFAGESRVTVGGVVSIVIVLVSVLFVLPARSCA